MPSDEAAWLRCIIENRDEDWPRLTFADWLEERYMGQYAEFIRVQCALEKLPNGWHHCVNRGTCAVCALGRREHAIWQAVSQRVVNDMRPFSVLHLKDVGTQVSLAGLMRRGFVARVTATADDWEHHAAQILAATPLETVRLTTWPEEAIDVTAAMCNSMAKFAAWAKRWPTVKIEPPRMPQFSYEWASSQTAAPYVQFAGRAQRYPNLAADLRATTQPTAEDLALLRLTHPEAFRESPTVTT